MYTFSENVQLSAADLDQASLGTQACEERERERERERGGGGGLKGSAHFALQILVYIYIDRPTAVFGPAPGVKVGCCGQNLRVVTLCENDLLHWYMFLHIRLRIRH